MMKITKVEVLKVKTMRAGWNPVFCRIHTDAGIYGDGEAAVAYGIASTATHGMIRDYAKMIIGMDPMKNEVIWNKLYKGTFWGQNGGPVTFSALSAIDIALWDIKGKAYGAPLHELLGGKQRDSVRVYASQLQFGWDWNVSAPDTPAHSKPEEYAAAALKAVAEGYDCLKYDFFLFGKNYERLTAEDQTRLLTPDKLSMVEARVKAVREVIGDKVDIIAECHSFPDAQGAVQIGRMLEPYNILYFEEPNTPTPYMTRFISEKINIPIASGERIYSRWQYVPYFENRSIQVIQPDIGNCGGITEAKKICDMAHAYDVNVQPHICASGFSTSVALHLEAVIPNFIIHEHHINNRLHYNMGIAKIEPQPVNGRLDIPNEPGIGNEISEQAFKNASMYEVVE